MGKISNGNFDPARAPGFLPHAADSIIENALREIEALERDTGQLIHDLRAALSRAETHLTERDEAFVQSQLRIATLEDQCRAAVGEANSATERLDSLTELWRISEERLLEALRFRDVFYRTVSDRISVARAECNALQGEIDAMRSSRVWKIKLLVSGYPIRRVIAKVLSR